MSDPFAASPAATPEPTGPTIPCAKCATPVDPNLASWSDDGERICKRCEAVQTIDTGDTRAAQSIMGGGMAAFFIGLCSICYNPLLILSVMAFTSGVTTLVLIARHPEYRERMGWRYPVTIAASVLGILFSLVIPLILVLGVLGAVLTR